MSNRWVTPALVLLSVALFLSALVVTNSFHVATDEGYFFQAAHRVASGELPYSGFFFFYPPLLPALLAPVSLLPGLWPLLGVQLLVGVLAVAGFWLAYLIAREFFSEPMSIALALATSLVLYLKFPLFVPSYLANTLVLLYVLVYLRRERYAHSSWLLGIIAACVFLTKMHLGVYLGLAVLIVALSQRWGRWWAVLKEVIHLALGPLVLAIYLVVTRTVGVGYEQLVAFPRKFGALSIAAADLNFAIVQLLMVCGIILLLLFLVWIPRRSKARIVLAVAAMMLLQALLYRDYIHFLDGCFLVPLAACVIWTAPGLHAKAELRGKAMRAKATQAKKAKTRSRMIAGIRSLLRLAAVGFALMVVVLALAIIVRYQLREATGLRLSHGMLMSASMAEYGEIAGRLDSGGEGSGLFVFPNDAMLYVIGHKQNPTPYNQFLEGYHEEDQVSVIALLEQSHPVIVVRKGSLENNSYAAIAAYIAANTTVTSSTEHYELRALSR